MIVEDERPGGRMSTYKISTVSWPRQIMGHKASNTICIWLVTDDNMSKRLQKDLIEHKWALAVHESIV
jgi:hypothetical protein